MHVSVGRTAAGFKFFKRFDLIHLPSVSAAINFQKSASEPTSASRASRLVVISAWIEGTCSSPGRVFAGGRNGTGRSTSSAALPKAIEGLEDGQRTRLRVKRHGCVDPPMFAVRWLLDRVAEIQGQQITIETVDGSGNGA
jgi:hypothetical protein